MTTESASATAVLSSVALWVKQAGVTPPPVGSTFCRVPDCTALPFAEIRSKDKRLQVCLRHYEATCAEADLGWEDV